MSAEHRRPRNLPTFDFSFVVWIFVKNCHLLLPVELVFPVWNHFLEVSGIEAILEGATLQRIGVTASINALVEVLLNDMSLSYPLHRVTFGRRQWNKMKNLNFFVWCFHCEGVNALILRQWLLSCSPPSFPNWDTFDWLSSEE